MSGGSFNYKCFQIQDFADELEEKILTNNAKDEYGFYYNYNKGTIQILKQCLKLIRTTANLAHSIEWLYSGDYGEEDFKELAMPELQKIKEEMQNG